MPDRTAGPQADPASRQDGADLVERLRRGDPAAFRQLVREHTPRLFATARRLTGNDHDAQDCLQEAFIQVYRKIDQFEGRSALGTWLHRIVINAAISRLRSRRDGEESLDEWMPRYDQNQVMIGPLAAPPLSPEDVVQKSGTRDAVRAAIDKLPPVHRSVLLLRDIEGYSTQEAADALGIEISATKVRLHRARIALKALLEPLFREDGL